MSNPKKPKQPVNAAASRRGHQLPARVEDPLWELLRAEAKLERRSIAQTVVILLEEALLARGRTLAIPDKEAGS
ncbi:MAG: hypothetical protein IT429_00915 [Gemmataceae bacterium]|nr:hypothetical protein [Gemmataceae bacterium]